MIQKGHKCSETEHRAKRQELGKSLRGHWRRGTDAGARRQELGKCWRNYSQVGNTGK